MDKEKVKDHFPWSVELARVVGPSPACPCAACVNHYKSKHQIRVEQFMEKAGQEVPSSPQEPSKEVRLLRAKLILEEAFETIEALGVAVYLNKSTDEEFATIDPIWFEDLELAVSPTFNLTEVADGCADLSVVTTGTLSACGIKDVTILEEVDKNNLSKFSEGGHKDKNGKWIKPKDWKPPQIKERLEEQNPTLMVKKVSSKGPITPVRRSKPFMDDTPDPQPKEGSNVSSQQKNQ